MVNCMLIGGSPSTGSSVLVNILNRHPEVLAGPETYLFMHPKLFLEWEANKRYLLETSWVKGLKSEGWFRMNGADLLQPFYQNPAVQLREMVTRAEDLTAFSNSFFQKALQTKGARIWVEKSPSNALCFDHFLNDFPSGKVVHTTRNPYDTIASLMARGLSVYSATAFYLINTAFALKSASDSRHFLLRYEDWVQRPEVRLQALLEFFGLSWKNHLLQPEEGEEVRMEGWLHSEKGALNAGSIGRFERLSPEEQGRIRWAVQQMRMNPIYGAMYGLAHHSIREICDILDYPFLPAEGTATAGIRLARLCDRWARLVRFYPHWGKKYPVVV